MVAVIQPSFSAGEVSKRVQARVDLSKRTVAVEKGLNALVSVTGALDKRPGTEYIADTYNNDPGRLIPFTYNRDQTYVLVFTDYRVRVYRDGDQKDSVPSPYAYADLWELRYAQYGDQLTIVHPNYAPREFLRSADTVWTFETISFAPLQPHPTDVVALPNARTDTFTVSSITKADPGVVTTSSAHGFAGNDTVFFRNNTDMVEVANGYYKASSITSTTFELQDPEDNTDVSTIGNTTFTTGTVYDAPLARSYIVTAVNAQTGEESLAGTSTVARTLTGVNSLTPARVNSPGHGFLTGDVVTFDGTGSILDGERFNVTRTDNTYFTLQWLNGEDVIGSDVNESGGTITPCFDREPRSLDTKWDNTISWTQAADAVIYNVYASDGGAFGLIGSTTGKSFRDYYITPDTSIAPPRAQNPFFDPEGGTSRYPATVAYHDQRRVFGRSDDYTNRLWMTQAGNFYNLTWSTPTQDDDAIVASIASSQINDVEHLLSLSDLICMTGGAEFKVDGGGAALTPSTVTITPQSFYGAGGMPPLLAGGVGMLHLTGNVIRDFEYSITTQTFVGVDLTILARHLFDPLEYTLVDWSYAHTPSALLLVVREDGVAPAFTYFPEQEVFGWTRWTTEGDFLSVCAIPENGVSRMYALVSRDIGGTTTHFLERFALPDDDIYSYHGVDCGVHWVQTPITVGNVTITAANKVKITSSGHGLSDGDIVDVSGVYEVGADGVEVLSDELNGDGFVVGDALVNQFYLKTAAGDYYTVSGDASYSSQGEVREAVTTVSGLGHLNGETVVAAANGQEVTGLVVSGGSVTLPSPASEVHVGFPFTYEVITLPVSAYSTGGVIEGVMKNVNRFALHVITAADFYAGPSRDGLVLHEGPAQVDYQRHTMMEKSQLVTSRGSWSRNRSMMLQQRSPLPMSVASIIPDALLGET